MINCFLFHGIPTGFIHSNAASSLANLT
jgi:hypothetical protein